MALGLLVRTIKPNVSRDNPATSCSHFARSRLAPRHCFQPIAEQDRFLPLDLIGLPELRLSV